jgi:hypothetical protein
MACNCTTTEQLNALYAKYGADSKLKRGNTLKSRIKYYTYKFALSATMLLVIPMLVTYVIYLTLYKGGKLSLTKFFNLKGDNIVNYYDRKQQEYKDKNKSRE